MSGGIPPLSLPAGATAGTALQPGQPMQAVVRLDAGGNAFIKLAGLSLPLPQAAEWQAGQRVQVTMTGTPAQPRLELALLPQAASPPPSPNADALLRMLERLLPALSSRLSPQAAVALLPGAMPITQANVSAMLQLLLSPGTGEGWGALVKALQGARAAGVHLPERAAELVQVADSIDGTDVARMLKWLAGDSRAEARMGLSPEQTLRQLVRELMDDPALRAFLKDQGGEKAFMEAGRQVLGRLDTAATANLRGLDGPYFFFELPPGMLPGAQRAHIHVMPEGRQGAGDEQRRGADTVVLDLSLDTLGPMWIQLRRDAACVCDFHVADVATRDAIEQGSAELEEALREAGMPHPQVRVHGGHEADRPARLAAMLGGAPLDAAT